MSRGKSPVGRGPGPYQKKILGALRQAPGGLSRHELRARLFPGHRTISGTQRVALCRALKSLVARGRIEVAGDRVRMIGNDEWSTPQDIFDRLDREFGFTLDV